MWKNKLETLKKERPSKRGLNNGATQDQISILMKKVKCDLKKDIPQDYVNVLKYMNGLEFNGFILYGIDEEYLMEKPNQHINGIIHNNLIWYEVDGQEQYLFLGDSDISWYVYAPDSNCYLELDKPSRRIVNEYNTFTEMFELFLDCALS